jgi:hypothetical protein
VGTPDQQQDEQQTDPTGFEQKTEQRRGQDEPSAEEPKGDEEIKAPVAAGTPAMTQEIEDRG